MANAAVDVSNALADAVERSVGGVVRVDGGRRRPASGLVWARDLILTAAHAVEREEGIEVGLEGGDRVPATLVGRDAGTDLALLRVEGRPLSPLPRAAESSLRRGQLVLSLSRPGRSARVGFGVVSVLGDEWRTAHGARIERYLQSSIGLEPGFSGGPLLDVSGALLGLNSAGLIRGTPLALVLSTLERVTAALLSTGRVERGFLGVSSHPVRLPQELAAQLGKSSGLIVVGLQPGGPSSRAGLLLGDVLLSLESQALESIEDLQAALEDRGGKSVTLKLFRAGQELNLSVTTGTRG
jgi:S1-C subfamily serine protease